MRTDVQVRAFEGVEESRRVAGRVGEGRDGPKKGSATGELGLQAGPLPLEQAQSRFESPDNRRPGAQVEHVADINAGAGTEKKAIRSHPEVVEANLEPARSGQARPSPGMLA